MKWVLVFVYVSGFGLPVNKEIGAFTSEKECRFVATDCMKKNKDITAACDFREPKKEPAI